jgi:L-cysteine desulfidase
MQKELLNLLREGIKPATGCTEPIAVAYAVATARDQVNGQLESLDIQVDPNIYKNGLMVTIPGTKEKGLIAGGVLGFITGDPKKELRVIDNITENDLDKARQIIHQQRVKLSLKENYQGLYIEVILVTDESKARVIIKDSHLNIVSIEKIDRKENFKPFLIENNNINPIIKTIQKYELKELIKFTNEIPIDELDFLKEGIKMNLAIAEEGLKIENGVGAKFIEMVEEGLMANNVIGRAQILCSAAAQARMSGSRLPVMSTAGSGNHGITAFLTPFAVAEKKNIAEEKLVRSLVLTNLITLFIKSYTGTLSAMCGCGVAAGTGASAGIVYLLDGNKDQILGAMYNMVGSIAGIICDGAKEGCAYKLALASGWAVQSAILSIKGAIINKNDGILAGNFKELFKNLGYTCNPGMVPTDEAILKVMMEKEN